MSKNPGVDAEEAPLYEPVPRLGADSAPLTRRKLMIAALRFNRRLQVAAVVLALGGVALIVLVIANAG